MYSKRIGLIIGFHGCDKKLRDDIVLKEGIVLKPSDNKHDWLGSGSYFWENNAERALQFARDLQRNPRKNQKHKITEPSVLGAVIDLGYCLDLLDSAYLKMIKESYDFLCKTHKKYNKKIPENLISGNGELLARHLDCAVIESAHSLNKILERPQFDSVRGVFFEGNDLYHNAGFKEKNHIQIAIRNPNCIKGYFIPRKLDTKHTKLL